MASRKLDDLHGAFQQMAGAFLGTWEREHPETPLLVTCTLRSEAEQAALYAQGRGTPGRIVTDAKPGQSAHNYGLAFDIVPIVNGKLDWDAEHPIWGEIGAAGQAAGLQWLGAPGSQFVEFAHFQHPNWRVLSGLDQPAAE